MKRFSSIILLSILVLILVTPGQAGSLDAEAYSKNIQKSISGLNSLAGSLIALQSQFQIFGNSATENEDNSTTLNQLLYQLIYYHQMIENYIIYYERMQKIWDNAYADFKVYAGNSGTEYALQAKMLRNQVDYAIFDELRNIGVPVQLGNNSGNLQLLMFMPVSKRQLVARVADRITSLEGQLVLGLRELAYNSYRAQSFYYREVVGRKSKTP